MLSIGTLMAYTMVVIAVLVTRYTPGVESVTLENDGSDKTTKTWMKTLCCSSDETDDRADISYRQVQNIDEETRSSKEEPDEKTSTRARVGVFTLTLSITAFLICLTRTYSYLGRAEAWAILLCCSFGLPIVASLMYIIRQPKNSAKFPFTVPGVPFVPAIAIFFNVLLIVNLNPWTYIRFSVWTALGELLPTEEVGGGGGGRVTGDARMVGRCHAKGEAQVQNPKGSLTMDLIGHFRVPKVLSFKMRPSAQPFL